MKPRGPMRRVVVVLTWLIAGAAVNVAVAWGITRCASYGQLHNRLSESYVERDSYHLWPPQWKSHRVYIEGEASHAGVTWIHVEAGGHSDNYGMISMWITGFPYRCLSGRYYASRQTRWTESAIPLESTANAFNDDRIPGLPISPLWPGFAINTLFYAGVLWMLCCGPFALRRMIRRRRGRCPQCSYPIGQSPVCTECGAPHAVPPTPKAISA